MHEAALHEDNCFLTLTYSPELMPKDGSLCVRHFQLFMKRLRWRIGTHRQIKFFHCGEYGERTGRPHYHACIFGYDFPDKVFYKRAGSGDLLFSSSLCDELWAKGFATIGAVTFESAAYVARYVMKKVQYGKEGRFISVDGVPGRTDVVTGEVLAELQPEYVTMSRGGRDGHGVAYDWFQKYGNEVFPADEVIVRGKKARPPRYYSQIYEAAHSLLYSKICRERRKRLRLHDCDNTASRLADREACAKARSTLLKRSVDDET